jgi:hypothetical protein
MDVVHPFDGFYRVLGESGVRGADSYGWSCHDCVEQTAHAGLSEYCGSWRTGRRGGQLLVL